MNDEATLYFIGKIIHLFSLENLSAPVYYSVNKGHNQKERVKRNEFRTMGTTRL